MEPGVGYFSPTQDDPSALPVNFHASHETCPAVISSRSFLLSRFRPHVFFSIVTHQAAG